MQFNKDLLFKTLALIVPTEGLDLGPLTRNRPQPLLPFGRDRRVIDFAISNCRRAGLKKIFFHTAHPGLLQIEQPQYVLVLLTNHVYEMDYGKLLEFHVDHGGQMTVVTSGNIDAGAYVFNAGMFRRLLLMDAMTSGNQDLARTTMSLAAHARDIHTCQLGICSGTDWGPVDTIDNYYRTQLSFSPSGSACGVISPLAHIAASANVTDSILMKGVHVGDHARIRKAIVEENLRIPEGILIGYDAREDRKRFIVSKGGVVVVDRLAIERVRADEDRHTLRLVRAA